MLAEIWKVEDKRDAHDAVTAFQAAYGAKFPKAVAKITDDVDQLLAFYDYPAEHWIHLNVGSVNSSHVVRSVALALWLIRWPRRSECERSEAFVVAGPDPFQCAIWVGALWAISAGRRTWRLAAEASSRS